jgi:nucleotide-binding universal stress UspA family protein
MARLRQRTLATVRRSGTETLRPLKALAVIDGSERTGRVIECALNLAQHGCGLEVVLLGIVRKPPEGRLRGYGSFKRDEIHARLTEIIGERAVVAAARRFDKAGVLHKDRIEIGEPAATILDIADEEGCDLILIGDTVPGALQRWLANAVGLSVMTVASQVVHLAAIPVLVVK